MVYAAKEVLGTNKRISNTERVRFKLYLRVKNKASIMLNLCQKSTMNLLCTRRPPNPLLPTDVMVIPVLITNLH